MSTIKLIDLATAPEASAKLLKVIEDKVQRPVNMLRMFAHSPAMLDAYVHFLGTLEQCQLSPQLRSLISATVAQEMGGEYMLAGVYVFGPHEGASAAQIDASRSGKSENPKTEKALQFTLKVIRNYGKLPPAEVESLSQAGFSDQEIVEMISIVGLNVWRNLFNLLVQTPNDFPPVKL